MNKITIPYLIKNYRKSLVYSQKEFGDKYNVGYKAVMNWESGLRTPPANVIEDALNLFFAKIDVNKVEAVVKAMHLFTNSINH